MGQVLDTVPNRMGIAGGANHWWNDLLEHGPSSRTPRTIAADQVLGHFPGALLERV